MIKDKRQMSPTLDGIRDDHLERYRFAAEMIKQRGIESALDVGCGCGYGSYVLAKEAGLSVIGYDVDQGAIDYGKKHYKTEGVHRFVSDLCQIMVTPKTALVMFEIIEHSRDAPSFLKRAASKASILVGSVPNEKVVPFKGPRVHPEHYRHYTADEMKSELYAAGWDVLFMGSQPGKHRDQAKIINGNFGGRTLVFVAEPLG